MTGRHPVAPVPDQPVATVRDPHAAAVWVRDSENGAFAGSGFALPGGLVVTAAHVVAGRGRPEVVHPAGTYQVARVTAVPEEAGEGVFHPYPDLALLTLSAHGGAAPTARLAPADPAPGTEVIAVGYSTHTPVPGVQPDTLTLRVGGRSASYTRVLGDSVRDGFSGSMLVESGTGLVAGVLKGSRSYRDALGGWFTPVSALHALLAAAGDEPACASGTAAAGRTTGEHGAAGGEGPPPPGPPASDTDLVDALMAFPALARAGTRYDLLDAMGVHLRLPYPFEAEERPGTRDHLRRIVRACRRHRDERAALHALYLAMEETVPYDKALEHLRDVVGRAAGGWGTRSA